MRRSHSCFAVVEEYFSESERKPFRIKLLNCDFFFWIFILNSVTYDMTESYETGNGPKFPGGSAAAGSRVPYLIV